MSAEEENKERLDSAAKKALAAELRKIDVLVVDDNAHMRSLVRQVLVAIGVGSVREASDGMAAFSMLKERRADVIVTDWMMEPLNGVEFVKLLRTAPDSPDQEVAVIMLTGHTERSRIVQARDVGVDEILAKPFSPRALYDRLYEVITNPRPFIKKPGYAGPEKRNQVRTEQELSRRRRRIAQINEAAKAASDKAAGGKT